MPCEPTGLRYDCAADSVSHARRTVRAILAAWGYDQQVIDTALLIVSELATNAILHARHTEAFKVICHTEAHALAIGVRDHDDKPPQFAGGDLDADHGRGLLLVEALADKWGWLPCQRGKIVFACLMVKRPLKVPISKPLVLT